jgi:hypothetical protein
VFSAPVSRHDPDEFRHRSSAHKCHPHTQDDYPSGPSPAITAVRSRLFCINREGRNPNAHPYKHCKATNRPCGSPTHPSNLRSARTRNPREQTLTDQEKSKDARTDFPNMLSHKGEHHLQASIHIAKTESLPCTKHLCPPQPRCPLTRLLYRQPQPEYMIRPDQRTHPRSHQIPLVRFLQRSQTARHIPPVFEHCSHRPPRGHLRPSQGHEKPHRKSPHLRHEAY